jgi:beta-glucanase (GH16 family)
VYDSTHGAEPHARVPSLVTVEHGVLHVSTSGDQGSGLCLCGPSAKPDKPYGRWDVRARASVNPDHGFAILLWPNSNRWPQDGEIDIAEFPGDNRSLLQTTVHYGADNHRIMKITHGDFATWHTYSVVWRPSALTFLLDGRTVLHVTDRAAIPHTPMHLALQAGVNSDVTAASDTSATLDVASVRVSK